MAVFQLGESNAPIVPMKDTLGEAIQDYCSKVNKIVAYRLHRGFDATVNGQLYHFDFDEDDQRNLALDTQNATISLYLSNVTEAVRRSIYPTGNYPVALQDSWTTTWQGTSTDGVRVSISMDLIKFLEFSAQATKFRNSELEAGRKKKRALHLATTFSELDAVATGLRIDEMLRVVRDAAYYDDPMAALTQLENSIPNYTA